VSGKYVPFGADDDRKPQSAPPEGGSSSATPSRGKGSQGTKRTREAFRSASAAHIASCVAEPRSKSGVGTTCSVGVVASARVTFAHERTTTRSARARGPAADSSASSSGAAGGGERGLGGRDMAVGL